MAQESQDFLKRTPKSTKLARECQLSIRIIYPETSISVLHLALI